MSNDLPRIPPAEGEILGPAGELPALRSQSGVPFGVEVRNWSERRKLESFAKLYRVQVEVLSLLVQQRELSAALYTARERAFVQLNNLPALREIEEHKINEELETRRHEAEMRGFRFAIEKTKLQAELAELQLRTQADLSGLRVALEEEELQAGLADARQRRERLQTSSSSTAAEHISAAFTSIREMDEAIRREKETAIRAMGGEDNLSEEQRDQLDQLEVLRRVHIENLMERVSAEIDR